MIFAFTLFIMSTTVLHERFCSQFFISNLILDLRFQFITKIPNGFTQGVIASVLVHLKPKVCIIFMILHLFYYSSVFVGRGLEPQVVLQFIRSLQQTLLFNIFFLLFFFYVSPLLRLCVGQNAQVMLGSCLPFARTSLIPWIPQLQIITTFQDGYPPDFRVEGTCHIRFMNLQHVYILSFGLLIRIVEYFICWNILHLLEYTSSFCCTVLLLFGFR